MSTQNRHAVIIGGGTGVGLETARRLAASGAQVTIGGRNRDRIEAAAKETGARGIPVDAMQKDSLTEFYAEAGGFTDLVVTLTRRGGAGPLAEVVEDDIEGAFAGKPIAHLRAVALALPTLAADGSVTLVSAVSPQASLAGTAGLGATNGAVEGAIRPLAVELAPRRVNCVSPGVINTPWWEDVPADAKAEAFKTFADRALVGRNGTPQDVAHAITALIENTFITGVILHCDGGLRHT